VHGEMAARLPPIEELQRIACPVERSIRLCKLARAFGTLPPAYAVIRDASLAAALDNRSRKVVWLANLTGVTPSRISHLVNRHTASHQPKPAGKPA
jgi:hypothetical protein